MIEGTVRIYILEDIQNSARHGSEKHGLTLDLTEIVPALSENRTLSTESILPLQVNKTKRIPFKLVDRCQCPQKCCLLKCKVIFNYCLPHCPAAKYH